MFPSNCGVCRQASGGCKCPRKVVRCPHCRKEVTDRPQLDFDQQGGLHGLIYRGNSWCCEFQLLNPSSYRYPHLQDRNLLLLPLEKLQISTNVFCPVCTGYVNCSLIRYRNGQSRSAEQEELFYRCNQRKIGEQVHFFLARYCSANAGAHLINAYPLSASFQQPVAATSIAASSSIPTNSLAVTSRVIARDKDPTHPAFQAILPRPLSHGPPTGSAQALPATTRVEISSGAKCGCCGVNVVPMHAKRIIISFLTPVRVYVACKTCEGSWCEYYYRTLKQNKSINEGHLIEWIKTRIKNINSEGSKVTESQMAKDFEVDLSKLEVDFRGGNNCGCCGALLHGVRRLRITIDFLEPEVVYNACSSCALSRRDNRGKFFNPDNSIYQAELKYLVSWIKTRIKNIIKRGDKVTVSQMAQDFGVDLSELITSSTQTLPATSQVEMSSGAKCECCGFSVEDKPTPLIVREFQQLEVTYSACITCARSWDNYCIWLIKNGKSINKDHVIEWIKSHFNTITRRRGSVRESKMAQDYRLSGLIKGRAGAGVSNPIAAVPLPGPQNHMSIAHAPVSAASSAAQSSISMQQQVRRSPRGHAQGVSSQLLGGASRLVPSATQRALFSAASQLPHQRGSSYLPPPHEHSPPRYHSQPPPPGETSRTTAASDPATVAGGVARAASSAHILGLQLGRDGLRALSVPAVAVPAASHPESPSIEQLIRKARDSIASCEFIGSNSQSRATRFSPRRPQLLPEEECCNPAEHRSLWKPLQDTGSFYCPECTETDTDTASSSSEEEPTPPRNKRPRLDLHTCPLCGDNLKCNVRGNWRDVMNRYYCKHCNQNFAIPKPTCPQCRKADDVKSESRDSSEGGVYRYHCHCTGCDKQFFFTAEIPETGNQSNLALDQMASSSMLIPLPPRRSPRKPSSQLAWPHGIPTSLQRLSATAAADPSSATGQMAPSFIPMPSSPWLSPRRPKHGTEPHKRKEHVKDFPCCICPEPEPAFAVIPSQWKGGSAFAAAFDKESFTKNYYLCERHKKALERSTLDSHQPEISRDPQSGLIKEEDFKAWVVKKLKLEKAKIRKR